MVVTIFDGIEHERIESELNRWIESLRCQTNRYAPSTLQIPAKSA